MLTMQEKIELKKDIAKYVLGLLETSYNDKANTQEGLADYIAEFVEIYINSFDHCLKSITKNLQSTLHLEYHVTRDIYFRVYEELARNFLKMRSANHEKMN